MHVKLLNVLVNQILYEGKVILMRIKTKKIIIFIISILLLDKVFISCLWYFFYLLLTDSFYLKISINIFQKNFVIKFENIL